MNKKEAFSKIPSFIESDVFERLPHLMKEYEDVLLNKEDEEDLEATFDEINDLRKKAKAFNLIKKKEVDVYLLIHSIDCECYNQRSGYSKYSSCLLTQDEFKFLKEVLENENM